MNHTEPYRLSNVFSIEGVESFPPDHHSHSTAAQLLQNLVMGDSLALHPSPFTFEKSMGTDYTDGYK
jgi:hypothetical protein